MRFRIKRKERKERLSIEFAPGNQEPTIPEDQTPVAKSEPSSDEPIVRTPESESISPKKPDLEARAIGEKSGHRLQDETLSNSNSIPKEHSLGYGYSLILTKEPERGNYYTVQDREGKKIFGFSAVYPDIEGVRALPKKARRSIFEAKCAESGLETRASKEGIGDINGELVFSRFLLDIDMLTGFKTDPNYVKNLKTGKKEDKRINDMDALLRAALKYHSFYCNSQGLSYEGIPEEVRIVFGQNLRLKTLLQFIENRDTKKELDERLSEYELTSGRRDKTFYIDIKRRAKTPEPKKY